MNCTSTESVTVDVTHQKKKILNMEKNAYTIFTMLSEKLQLISDYLG